MGGGHGEGVAATATRLSELRLAPAGLAPARSRARRRAERREGGGMARRRRRGGRYGAERVRSGGRSSRAARVGALVGERPAGARGGGSGGWGVE